MLNDPAKIILNKILYKNFIRFNSSPIPEVKKINALFIKQLRSVFQSTPEDEEFIYIPDHEKARLQERLKELQKS